MNGATGDFDSEPRSWNVNLPIETKAVYGAWALEKVIGVEEQAMAVEAEISQDFLNWTRGCHKLVAENDIPTVVAEPAFVDFIHWLSARHTRW